MPNASVPALLKSEPGMTPPDEPGKGLGVDIRFAGCLMAS